MFFFLNDTATTEIYTLSYTTLFRSSPAEEGEERSQVERRREERGARPHVVDGLRVEGRQGEEERGRRGREACVRSEEHTSELQSQSNLVCRLLLEKKKKKQ